MPVEIIDLLSSPELPRAAISISEKSSNTQKKSQLLAPARTLTYEPPKSGVDDDWFTLSSDGIDSTLPKSTAATRFYNTSSKADAHPTSKVTQAKPGKAPNNNFFLSDDFDSTINLDDPFAVDFPPHKKRRLSSSPKPTLPKSTLPKSREFKRSISNIKPSSTKGSTHTRPAPSLNRSKTTTTILESDPILFTSSPDPFADAARKRRAKTKEIWEEESDDDIDVSRKSKTGVTSVASKHGPTVLEAGNGNKLRDLTFDDSSDEELPDIDSLPPAKPTGNSKAALAKYNAEKKKSEKAEKEAEKERKRLVAEAKKERKRLAKEEKSRSKEKNSELAKVNTLRTDKKVSTSEMIIELSSSLNPTLVEQVKGFLGPLQVEHSDWENPLPVIRWKRKVVAEYNNALEYWEPKPLRIKSEKHIVCVITAKDFVDMVMADEKNNLDAHILQLRATSHAAEIIYLIEGLVSWMRKNKNVKNRQFTAAVRGQLMQEEPSASQRKRKKEPEYVDEDMIEGALLKLQVVHGALIHHTAAKIETAEWVVTFTQHISTIPYRTQKETLDTAFCMESGQVKTGDTPENTFTKMLQEIIRITAPVAYGIAAEYPSVKELVRGLKENGPLALEDLKKMANKDGAFTDRRIGPSISKRVYNVFMGMDPGSWDV
ncbi:hypothetical protein G7Y89_g6978 [Cudoniella acicularis]|uniref:ERCC4 domain-containing protein n=1 Tax=Cudoniella acicularis TaxID=354080 RepID=A0A8H4RM02_9HELO|nr:hypothetical protein G7Y89_g6978 [Cudoniella acicularis]